ncbi:hypothetical protein C1645_835243 [Glomus cerebriforme]|uniref:Uncharacterized protein n=1 Tax=Glomus cerebriforme TaxID=658196 RepID=A0A397SIA7_9GLOM|nr:hypothetical protein C1645_835243 [Glomus cerebriforme]
MLNSKSILITEILDSGKVAYLDYKLEFNIGYLIWILVLNFVPETHLGLYSSILSTCLPKESKDLLFKNGVIISTSTSKLPLFNYPSFCKVLPIDDICQIINFSLEKTPITTISKEDKNYLVINEVIKY